MKVLESPESRTVLENVRWETYVELAEQRRGSVPRMAYDRGVFEMMSPKRQHKNIGRLIGRLVETYSEVKNIEIQSVASTTFKRKDLQKAFEAVESYNVTDAESIRPHRQGKWSVGSKSLRVTLVVFELSAISWNHEEPKHLLCRSQNGWFRRSGGESRQPRVIKGKGIWLHAAT